MKWLITPILITFFMGGCALTPEYGSHGPNETWLIVDQGDDGAAEVQARVKKQRSWGWASQYVTSSYDEPIRRFSVGPFSFAGDDTRYIEVHYSLFADPPVYGHIEFSAVAEDGYVLPDQWQVGFEHEVEMSKGWKIASLTVPQLRVPTKSVHVRWVTEGVVESSDESASQAQVDKDEE
jgi:hypothetical protein